MVGGFLNKLQLTVWHFTGTIIAMVITRAILRSMYLDGTFSLGQLQLEPQYGIMTLFFVVFVVGLAAVGYMIKTAVNAGKGGATV